MTELVDKITKQLQKANLSLVDRIALVTALLGKLSALPIKDSIDITPTKVIIGGKELDQESAIHFRENLVLLHDNQAWQLVKSQLMYEAMKLGINTARTIEDLYFSKAVIWTIENENKIVLESVARITQQVDK